MAKVSLGTPPMAAKDEYLHSHFISWNALEQIIIQMTNIRDPRIPIFTDLMISAVTDEGMREEFRVRKKQYYEEGLKDYKKPSNDDEAMAMVNACTRVLGDVRSWYDNMLGVTTVITYGVCGPQPGEEEDEAQFGGGECNDGGADGEAACVDVT